MLQFLFVAILQGMAGAPHVGENVSGAEQPAVTQAQPAGSETPSTPELTAPAHNADALAEPVTRTERQCRRERAGGSTRTAYVLVCRDVEVEVDAPTPQG